MENTCALEVCTIKASAHCKQSGTNYPRLRAVAAVTELQDDVVYNNPKQDDNVLVPAEFSLSLLATADSALEPERIQNTFYRPSVPNIRDPPLLRAI